METRGIRNKNPFNIKRSANHWHGKLHRPTDSVFEQFTSIKYGVRAGILLLRNGYLNKGFRTVEAIIKRYAPENENNVERYCNYIYSHTPLSPEAEIDSSLKLFHLCHAICMYESNYNLSHDFYLDICCTFKISV